MTHWLAIGDETGNWDRLEHRSTKLALGATLVMVPLDRWQAIFNETLGEATLETILACPAPGFEAGGQAKMQHHARDVLLGFGQARDPDAPGVRQLQGLLSWLHAHPDLVTVGAYGTADAVHAAAGLGDQAHALGFSYALALAPVLPFIGPADRIHLLLMGRTEDATSSAVARYTRTPADPRMPAPFRSLHAGVAHGLSRLDAIYGLPGIARASEVVKVCQPYDLTKISRNHANGAFIDRTVGGALADLGATLMQLTLPDVFSASLPVERRFPLPPLSPEGNACFTPISETPQ
ncbi:MAG: hypothetical protein IPQ01_05225 [Zoogloea sp.]|jgi:hypothetical protein|nr:hypothetical protein [Zoogloea sp.]